MPSRRPSPVDHVARHSLGLALAVPEVVTQRLTRMWLAGASPSRRDRDEFLRMHHEKIAAFYESWAAMGLEMFRASLALALLPTWTGGFTGMSARIAARNQRAAMRVLAAGLGPVHRRAAANAKRLRRTR